MQSVWYRLNSWKSTTQIQTKCQWLRVWYKLNFEPCPFFASHRHSFTEGLSVAPTTHTSLREQHISGPKSLPAKWEDRVRWQILRMQNLVQSKSKKLLLRSQVQKAVLACLSFFEVEIVAAFLPQTHHFMQYSFFWAAITAITFNESMSQWVNVCFRYLSVQGQRC